MLRTASARGIRTFDARHTHAVDNVVREPEGDSFGYFEGPSLRTHLGQPSLPIADATGAAYLVKEAVEVDMDGIARRAVEEDILAMTVTEPRHGVQGRYGSADASGRL